MFVINSIKLNSFSGTNNNIFETKNMRDIVKLIESSIHSEIKKKRLIYIFILNNKNNLYITIP